MKIKLIMSKPVATAKRTASVKDVISQMSGGKIGGVVITEKKVPIGIFTKRDLLGVLVNGVDPGATEINAVMHTPVLPINENENFIGAASQMNRLQVRRFIVVDPSGHLAGIVTDMDVVKNYALSALSYKTTLAAVSSPGLTATPSTPLKKICRMMHEENRSCVVILKNKKPVGIVNEALIVKLSARLKDPLKGTAEKVMIKRFCSAVNTDSLREAVLSMIQKDFRNIIVTDDEGKFQDVVSLRDLVTFIINSQM